MTVTPRFTGFIGTPDGERRLVEGEPWADDDPFVKANPHAFIGLATGGVIKRTALVGESGPESVEIVKPTRVSARREAKS